MLSMVQAEIRGEVGAEPSIFLLATQVLENSLWYAQGMRVNTCLQLLDATDEMQQHFEGPFVRC